MTALRVLNRGSTGWIPFIGVKISGHQPELWWSYSYSLFLFVAWGLSLNYYRVLNGAVLVLHNFNLDAHIFLDGVIKKQYILASVILSINLQYLTLNFTNVVFKILANIMNIKPFLLLVAYIFYSNNIKTRIRQDT